MGPWKLSRVEGKGKISLISEPCVCPPTGRKGPETRSCGLQEELKMECQPRGWGSIDYVGCSLLTWELLWLVDNLTVDSWPQSWPDR